MRHERDASLLLMPVAIVPDRDYPKDHGAAEVACEGPFSELQFFEGNTESARNFSVRQALTASHEWRFKPCRQRDSKWLVVLQARERSGTCLN